MRLIVFIQPSNPLNGIKRFPEVTGGGRYFFLERVRGLTLSIEIPSMVGVWIFSGNTHDKYCLNL